MDEASLAKRSMSYCSLHSNYTAHENISRQGYLTRRPLRSVHENTKFLRSPGPLESMLKTTTETGDIGIYSIKPTPPPLPSTYYPSIKQSPSLDGSMSTRSGLRGRREHGCPDDRRRLPSYRDTASEIISMYASDSHQSSYYGPLSPPFDENSRRSYSMTTCSSRRLPSHKSSATFQSQCSNSALQRPRSPFPYPTRLKRPDVRPSSPALTEDGSIDYRRMVGINRVSSRTVHGSYKPIYPHGHHRPPPISMPPESHRPNAWLSQSPTASYVPSDLGHRDNRARGGSQWSNKQSEPPSQFSSDQNVRSSSLTSIVEIIRRPASQRLRFQASFYYDYSEGFDHCGSPVMLVRSPASPFAPIPRRISSLTKPLVLRNESQARLDAVVDVSIKDCSEASTRDGNLPEGSPPTGFNEQGSEPGQKTSSGIREPEAKGIADSILLNTESRTTERQKTGLETPKTLELLTNLDGPRLRDESSTQREADSNPDGVHGYTVSSSPLQGDVDQFDEEGTTRKLSHLTSSLPSQSKLETPSGSKRFSSHGTLATLLRNNLHTSLDPGLIDLAGFAQSMEKMARSPFSKKDDDSQVSEPNRHGGTGIVVSKASQARSVKQSFHRHRRNRAAMQLGTSKPLASRSPANCVELLEGAQEPVTPERQVPLIGSSGCPKLPSDQPQSAQASSQAGDSTPFSERFIHSFPPFHLSDLSTPRTVLGMHGSTPETILTASVATSCAELEIESSETSDKSSLDKPEGTPFATDDKLTSTDRTVSTFTSSLSHQRESAVCCGNSNTQDSTLRRYSGSTSSEQRSREGYTGTDFFKPSKSKDHQSYQKQGRRYVLATPRSGATAAHPSARIHLSRIPLAHPVHQRDQRPSISTGSGGSGLDSLVSESAQMQTRGLRKKISNLRLRITQSKLHLHEPALQHESDLEEVGKNVKQQEEGMHTCCVLPGDNTEATRVTASADLGNRLKRWVDDARRAVKAYVRR